MNHILVKVNGKNIRNFLLKVAVNGIKVFNIKIVNQNEADILINKKDYDFLEQIKGIYEYEIIKEDILKNMKKKFFRNIHLIIILLINIALIMIASNHIYEIEIVEDNQEMKNFLSEVLAEKGIKKYAKKTNDLEKIKLEIINENKDKIEWIEIIPSGVKYIVKLEERIENKKSESEIPSNIIAKKDGIVKKVVASRGKVLVEKETYVKKGDILITGEIKPEILVSASGQVFAEVWSKIRVSEPIYEYINEYTGKSKKGLKIKIFNRSLNFYHGYKFNDIRENKIFKNDILPIYLSLDTINEVKYISHIRTVEEAKKAALEKARKEIQDKLKEDEKIISENELKVEIKDSKIILDVLFTTYEDISLEERIEVENVS